MELHNTRESGFVFQAVRKPNLNLQPANILPAAKINTQLLTFPAAVTELLLHSAQLLLLPEKHPLQPRALSPTAPGEHPDPEQARDLRELLQCCPKFSFPPPWPMAFLGPLRWQNH